MVGAHVLAIMVLAGGVCKRAACCHKSIVEAELAQGTQAVWEQDKVGSGLDDGALPPFEEDKVDSRLVQSMCGREAYRAAPGDEDSEVAGINCVCHVSSKARCAASASDDSVDSNR